MNKMIVGFVVALVIFLLTFALAYFQPEGGGWMGVFLLAGVYFFIGGYCIFIFWMTG